MKKDNQLKLQNVINQVHYIEEHRNSISDPNKIDQQVSKLQRLNQQLIDEFTKEIAEKYTEKTVKKHEQNLKFFLNEYLAYHLETIFGDEITDLEYPMNKGFSFNEMKETKTALKKFFTFLHDQQLLNNSDFEVPMEAWNEQLTAKKARSILQDMWTDDDYDLGSLDFEQPEVIFDQDTDELLLKYFRAFANLYGLISCDQAYRIICLQNPQLSLDVEHFIDFIGMVGDKMDEEVEIDFMHGDPQIVAPDIMDESDSIEHLMGQQFGKPYRVLSKKSLLKYADNDYFETGIATTAVINFYRQQLGVPQDLLKELVIGTNLIFRPLLNSQPAQAIGMVNARLAEIGYLPTDQQELKKFTQVLIDFYNNCPQWSNRGWTPKQIGNQPNVQSLLLGQTSLPPKLQKLVEKAKVDPMDILIWVNEHDDFSKITKTKMTKQILDLSIPSLGEEED